MDKLNKVGKRIGNIDDLPEELRSEVQGYKQDVMADQILRTINGRYDGIASIDEVLVGLYRDHLVVQKRAFVASKLYRMAKEGLIRSVKEKKGVYEIDPLA